MLQPSSPSIRLARSLAFVLSLAATTASAQTADTVLFNGKILTVDKEFSTQQALAIGHGRIVATGTSAAMKKLAGDKAKLIDLGGRTVIPGLTDGHIHGIRADRKSTRLNSSHQIISYAVFCLKKKKKNVMNTQHYALKSTMRLH